jgi:predicted Zn-dependent protease
VEVGGPRVFIDHRVEGIAQAEKDLANGNYHAAAGAVIRMIPHIKNYKSAQGDAIINRSMRVLAVAMARTNGDLTKISKELPDELHAAFLGANESARKANVEWAVLSLKALREKKKDDATLASELGEAMAQLPEQKSGAKELLDDLAKRDVLTTPEGYRALAVLRAEANDEGGRSEALNRCKNMAKDASICVAPATKGNGST